MQIRPMIKAACRFAFPFVTALTLAACGGGGGGGAQFENTAAARGSPSDARVEHFDRLNSVRAAMGLRPLEWNASLAAAADAHATYQRVNGTFGHGESPGSTGYTGQGYGERAAAAGYGGQLVAEAIIGAATPAPGTGAPLMDLLLASPGHRFILLAPEFEDAGVGESPLTTLVGAKGGRYVDANRLWTYPYPGMQGVGTAFSLASEPVNPLPQQPVVGFPISIHAGLFVTMRGSGAVLRGTAGNVVELVAAQGDGASRSALVYYPRQPLTQGETYEFEVQVEMNGLARTVTTKFTTGA